MWRAEIHTRNVLRNGKRDTLIRIMFVLISHCISLCVSEYEMLCVFVFVYIYVGVCVCL